MSRLTHIDAEGRARMVDVSDKPSTAREAVATGLVRMAAAHYRFAAIHPFADRNGRTNRILNVLMLVDAGLLRQPLLYLSRYISETKSEYYRLLLAVTVEDTWEEWVLYVLNGVERSSRETVQKVGAIRELQENFARRARAASRGDADRARD